MLALRIFREVIREDGLTVITPDGRRHGIGHPGNPSLAVRLANDRWLGLRLACTPSLALGEAYMDGTITVEGGTIYDVLDVLARNIGHGPMPGVLEAVRRRLPGLLQWLEQTNPLGRARSNVAHHYDLPGRLYELFLDADRQYSCAYYPRPDMTLEEAQDAKKRHIAAKLLLMPSQKVLDIGSGWGGLGLYLAREAGVEVTGLTLSTEQHAIAEERARRAGLSNQVRFLLRDYRQEQGRYDRIVSVGMFEHVGTPHYGEFFRTAARLLKDDGVMLLHSIGRMDGPGTSNPWLRKYIFPGGYTPALSEVLPEIERAGLWVTDVEILRLHYAETLRAWRDRFMANRDEAKAMLGERFCRMWEFYLAGCEVAFRHMGQMVFQIQLAKRVDAVPLTRDYIAHWESRRRPVASLAS